MVFIFALGVNSAVMSDEAIRLNRGGLLFGLMHRVMMIVLRFLQKMKTMFRNYTPEPVVDRPRWLHKPSGCTQFGYPGSAGHSNKYRLTGLVCFFLGSLKIPLCPSFRP